MVQEGGLIVPPRFEDERHYKFELPKIGERKTDPMKSSLC